MKTSSRKSKKNLLALALSFVMIASGASAFAACDNGENDDSSSDSSSKPSTSVNSDLKIENGDFETFNTNDGATVIGTNVSAAPGWNRASLASNFSSNAASGIVNVSEWAELTTSKVDVSKLTVDQAKALFKEEGAMTIKDKLDYYEVWKENNKQDESKIATKLKDFYENFNIASKDLPMDTERNPLTESPLTHDYTETAGFGENKNVLMIHNNLLDAKKNDLKASGTAQKYSSSTTVTVAAGTAATFSVWVKTMDLYMQDTDGNLQEAVNVGAFINVSHSVGSKSLPVLTVKNIDTSSVTDNNGWKQYSFTLKGSAYSNTTFSIELGLGMGTNSDQLEFVNGYAFFDDVDCQTMSYERYDALTSASAATAPDKTVDFNSTKEEKTFAVNGDMSLDNFSINLCYALTNSDILSSIAADDTMPTVSKLSNGTYVTSLNGGYSYTDKDGNAINATVYEYLKNGFSNDKDVHQVFNTLSDIKTAASNNIYLEAIYDKYFTDDKGVAYDFTVNSDGTESPILMLLSAHGVAYTLESDYEFTFPIVGGEQKDYLAVSFFAKTSDMTGFTGASVTLNDGYEKYTFGGIDTTNTSPVKVDLNADLTDPVADEDVHDGWQQYFFFVENNYEDINKTNAKFTLTFNFGPTEIDGTTDASYHEGFAAFTKFQVYPMSKAEYEAVSENSYTKVVSVVGSEEEKAAGNNGFDSAANNEVGELDNGFANPKTFTGAFSDCQYVNQTNGTHTNTNNYAYAGLLNKEGFAKYFTSPSNDVTSLLVSKLTMATGKSTAAEVWSTMFGYSYGGSNIGSRTQPLFILNTNAAYENDNKQVNYDVDGDGILDKAYGYYGNQVTVSANEYKKVSIAVKVGAFADDAANGTFNNNVFANVYLIDLDSDKQASALSIGRNLTYWYDKDGNICADEDCKVVAFKLQTNGLYKVNEEWNDYKALSAEEKAKYQGYFANLEAYEKDKKGNLIVAEGGASHDYDSYWNNEGLDGIAYYYNNGKYFADKACTIEVNNLLNVTKTETNATAILEARYLAIRGEETRQLAYQIGNTQGQWVSVSFYIHTGSEAKNYRLEVWSGERNGKGNPVDTYVAFDMNSDADAESEFTQYVTNYEDNKTDAKYANADVFENVFSWFDSDSYLRYNKSIDKNGIGNLYAESYTYADNESGIAYLQYKDSNIIRIFADYAFEDKTVTPTTPTDSSTDSSTSDKDESTGDETNFFMLFSSIAIAAVLVFVIAAVAVRKLLKKLGKLPKKSTGSKSKKEKKAKAETTDVKPEVKPAAPEAKEELDEESPYND